MDVRDLAASIVDINQNGINEERRNTLILNLLAVAPVTGAVKYADDAAGIAKYGDDIAEVVEVVAEHGDEVVEGIAEESKIITRPSWRESELDAAKDFPEYAAQKSFIDGEEVPYGTKGSVRPDYYKPGHSVDIKNYSIETKNGRSNLARNIEKQYYQRIDKLPEGTKQTVMK